MDAARSGHLHLSQSSAALVSLVCQPVTRLAQSMPVPRHEGGVTDESAAGAQQQQATLRLDQSRHVNRCLTRRGEAQRCSPLVRSPSSSARRFVRSPRIDAQPSSPTHENGEKITSGMPAPARQTTHSTVANESRVESEAAQCWPARISRLARLSPDQHDAESSAQIVWQPRWTCDRQ